MIRWLAASWVLSSACGPEPTGDTSRAPAVSVELPSTPGPSAEISSSAAAPSADRSASSADTRPSATPSAQPRETARGRCSGWTTLETDAGSVNCYPYRCRDDRCLTACNEREDCAGSLGPADFAEHGWPLDCRRPGAAAGVCVPLPPGHVRPRTVPSSSPTP